MVEDDPATIKALRTLLTRQGWDVATAGTIAEARVLLDLDPVCLVLDLMLPDGHGSTLIRSIREANRTIRIVVTTGSGGRDHRETLASLEPIVVLYKPIDLQVLFDKLGPVP